MKASHASVRPFLCWMTGLNQPCLLNCLQMPCRYVKQKMNVNDVKFTAQSKVHVLSYASVAQMKLKFSER